MLLKVEKEDLSNILEALYASEKIDLIEKLKVDAENILWGQNEGVEHLLSHIENWNGMKNQAKKPASFSDFTLAQAKEWFDLQQVSKSLHEETLPLETTKNLENNIKRGLRKALRTEKERSEALIAPLLDEIWEMNDFSFKIFSGEYVKVEESQGLKGEFDFALTQNPDSIELEHSIFTLVEAKQADISKHWGQLAAQMVAAQRINQDKNTRFENIFGCITTGEQWHFAELSKKQITIDTESYFIKYDLEKLLGIFQFIVDFHKEKVKV